MHTFLLDYVKNLITRWTTFAPTAPSHPTSEIEMTSETILFKPKKSVAERAIQRLPMQPSPPPFQPNLKITMSKEPVPAMLKHAENIAKLADSIVHTSVVLDKAGSSSSYFLMDPTKYIVAIIKPLSEERAVMPGIPRGYAALRELIAYYLFPNLIPSTALAQITSRSFKPPYLTKDCSIQVFIHNACPISILINDKPKKYFPHLFSRLSEIAELDLTVLNADRHGKNLLFIQHAGRPINKLIPIDHGCILPSNCASGGRFVWLDMIEPSLLFPVHIQYRITRMNMDEQILLLKKFLPSPKRIEAAKIRLSLPPSPITTRHEGVINTYTICVLLLKHLVKTTPIWDIAQYYLADDLHHSLLHSMLRMAAAQTTIPDGHLVPRENISKVIETVTAFISEKKLEPGRTFSDETLYQIVRNTLSDCVGNGEFDFPLFALENNTTKTII